MNNNDNCATVLEDINEGVIIEHKDINIRIKHAIALGHKFALEHINEGDYVIKYGQKIGIATRNILQGEWIHTHNIISSYLKEVLNL